MKDIIYFDKIELDASSMWQDDEGQQYMKSADHTTAYALIYKEVEEGVLDIVDIVEVVLNERGFYA